MGHKYNQEEVVDLVMQKKVPLLVRHGVIAMIEGTYRILKHTKTGKVWRTRERHLVRPKQVTATKEGFIAAFNIITSSFQDYNFIRARKDVIALTGHGREQNALHLRETDSRRRTSLFTTFFENKFAKEIEEWKITNVVGE